MKTAPDPKDVQEFQFKQSYTSQILDAFASTPSACSLLAADKKRGLLYAGQNNKIIILKPGEDSDPEWKLEFNISIPVSKLMLNCDCSYLAVAPHAPLILIYDAQALTKNSLQLLYEIRISTLNADVFVNDLRWNPAMPGMLCTVASDYTVGSFKIKEKKEKTIELKALEKFNGIDAMCAAWSPKGKQIVVGCKNGNIVQFKPDLKVARTIPGPSPYIGEVISILWISNYQFCAAYLGSEQRINVLIVDAPKGETNAIFTCYEDITYGMADTEGQGTTPCYYFDHVPEWGLIIAASSNSSEMAVLGSTDGGVNWNQWQLVDSGRAELPLICTTESYPVGLAIDKSPTRKLPWGAESVLPHPVPILHILATSGQLCSFHMVNLSPNCPPINCPPTEIIMAPPQAQINVAPETSLVMNGAITSTPRPKQSENIVERAKPIPTGNIFDKFVEGSNFFAQPPTEKIKQPEPKPENPIVAMKFEAPRENYPQPTIKSDIKLTPIKETIAQEQVDKKSSHDDDARDIRAYLEEHNLFEKELRSRLEPQTWECGTEEERQKLKDTSRIMDHFLWELRETTNSLSSDIAYLKALLLQSFAWVEETKSKNAATNDITTRSCGDNNKISDLQKLYYYTQTQLSQASKILDLEWSDHKSQEMSQMKIPHLEFVYQNLILHSKIIQGEKNKIQQLKKQWKLLTRNDSIFGINRSLCNLTIASSKSPATLPRNAGIIEARCKAIACKTFSFTEEKQNKLREHLSMSTPRIIKPVNPSPVQHRLEATLSSLASRNSANVDGKTKVGQPVLKQTPPSKQQTIEKAEQQSPLASLDSIVARIGTTETNNSSIQSKAQNKQLTFGVSLPPTSGVKLAEKKSSSPAITTTSQSTKSKQDVTFTHINVPTHTLPNLMKSFPKVDSISFGSPLQKPDENVAQKSVPKESNMKIGKDIVSNTETFVADNNLFTTSSLKDALTLGTASEKEQPITSNTGLKFGIAALKIPSTTKSDAMSTFSFATPTTVPVPAKSTVQGTFVSSQTTITQAFSFALKLSNTATPFNLKTTPSTTANASMPQIQDSLNITDGKYTYKPTFGIPGYQMFLEQNANGNNQVSISPVSGVSSKETVATTSSVSTTPSVTIEEVPSSESKASSPSTMQVAYKLNTSPTQTALTSATRLFHNLINTSVEEQNNTTPSLEDSWKMSTFGGMSNSSTTATPTTSTTTSTFAVTTTAPAVQTATTAPMTLFGGFNVTPATTAIASTTIATSNNISPFQTSLSKSTTFGEGSTNLPTSTTNTATTTSAALTFGNVATTSAPLNFGKLPLTMNPQFQSTPAVSSAASTFGKQVMSPTSIFGHIPTTSTTASIFSGSNTNSTFGGNNQASPTVSIFGGNASSINTFGTPQKSIFDNSAQKSESIFGSPANAGSAPLFGGTATTPNAALSSPGSASVFGAASPMGVEQPVLGAQPAFGQAPSFNSKPVFGSPPTFGAQKPIFGGGFGATAFGVSATPPAFGSPPAIGGTPAPIDNNMPKVFGNVSGSSTFESLATQSGGLSFGSLAQNTAETPKTPVFTTGSSFSTWR